MFEEYNAYEAVHYGNMGKKVAAYNTKLKKSLLLEGEGKPCRTTVLVQPYLANDQDKKALKNKAKAEGRPVQACISEPVAAVLYYTAQNPQMNKVGLIRVLNVHQDKAEVSFVRVQKTNIEVEFHQSMFMGSSLLVEKMTEAYAKKLRALDGDVLNYAKERLALQNCARGALFRLTSNRLAEDRFIYTSPQTGRAYEIGMKRIEFDELVHLVAGEFLKKIEKTDRNCHGTILCGGLCEYETFVNTIREKYRGAPVSAYKAHEAEVLGAAYYAKQIQEYQTNHARY